LFAINKGDTETAAKLIDAGAKLDVQDKVRESGGACGSCWRSRAGACVLALNACVCVRVCAYLCVWVFDVRSA